ncbi:hypothetical protein ABB37_03419 [Leptomonas pyrrhocoris]|uniref:Flagellar attachment zone protein 1 conserved domain-containing protein n=1 Tax=Leptomonas pyrrhocoris TaxID=157538 RepID=A0A0M9G551_LEPPY|nr:hypothetical protein ABB37_03419 [Leptomonas pyrrhocoris]KPA82326.1 hypothetical protein ABB37_03419 [Leptomonas pyrrhocoris]|eukprot:XP_015660765.1 hypothetical protein ABB37_03419 [Leptomonas pyrrhocoris]
MSTFQHSWVSVFGADEVVYDVPSKLVTELPAPATTTSDDSVDAGVPTVASVTTRLTKKFEGDGWKDLVATVPSLLRQTFVCEASIALDVPQEAISDVQFRLGSLYVTFHVTHDDDISQEEMDRRIEEYPFREMLRLYNQRDGAPDGLDAALQRLKDMEMELSEKERALEKERAAREASAKDLERQLEALKDEVDGPIAQREQELLAQLGKEQAGRKKAESQVKASEEQAKKLMEALKQEKLRAEKQAQRHNDLIAAIIQENKKEKEAKEREYNEQMEVKDYIIENLKSQLRTHTSASASPRNSIIDPDQSGEFSRLMERMEDMAQVLQRTQEKESEARAQVQRLSDALKQSEEARQAESVSYDNNVTALTQQLNSYRDTKLAEEHERRAKEDRQRGRGTVSDAMKENATIVRQYTTSLENLISSLQDRLNALNEEYGGYLHEAEEEVTSQRRILADHEEDSREIRQVFRSTSLGLQKIYWGTREPQAQEIIGQLDSAAGRAETSSAAVRVAIAMLDSKASAFKDNKDWMEQHQKMMRELLVSLRQLTQRALDRQRTMMDDAVAAAAQK